MRAGCLDLAVAMLALLGGCAESGGDVVQPADTVLQRQVPHRIADLPPAVVEGADRARPALDIPRTLASNLKNSPSGTPCH
jgi:hypothetical protein